MLWELGFPAKMIKWIMECITTVSYSILLNGMPYDPFRAKMGLKQGDPMSPYLFALCMEYLSRSLATLAHNQEFSYHPRCKRTCTIPLLFVDDLLIFCNGDVCCMY